MENLEARLERAIGERAKTRMERFQRDKQEALDEHRRRQRRQYVSDEVFDFREPRLWQEDRLHNPYFVRSRRKKLAYSTAKAISERRYTPSRPITFTVPKADGRPRQVAAFNIVDEAISHELLKSVTRKNLQRLSAHSYAYLPDRGPFDAIARIKSDWRAENRLYIAEFDFEDYFQSIDHDSLVRTMKHVELLLTPSEKFLINVFLTSMGETRKRGVVQGTSISVLLANIAAISLDRGLEKIGVGYARYADDTLVWGDTYEKVAAAANLIYEVARTIGASVNNLKSPGIRLLIREIGQAAEVSSTPQVTFLGHSISAARTRLSEASVERIKEVIQQIIYQNLLREPLKKNQDLRRLSAMDNDYVSCIWQLRSYIYGNLSEKELRRLGGGSFPSDRAIYGIVAYYPLADDREQWRDLDHWMNSQIRLALKKRLKLLPPRAKQLEPYPSCENDDLNCLANLQHPASNGQIVDLRIPSFTLMSGVTQMAVRQHGFRILRGGAGKYLYELD